jgi:hypothetical protein
MAQAALKPGMITTVLDPTQRRHSSPLPPFIFVQVEAEQSRVTHLEEVVARLSTAGAVISRFTCGLRCSLLLDTAGASNQAMQHDLLDVPRDLHTTWQVQQMCKVMLGNPASVVVVDAVVMYVRLKEEFSLVQLQRARDETHKQVKALYRAQDALGCAENDIAAIRAVNAHLTTKAADQAADIATLIEQNADLAQDKALLVRQNEELRVAHFAQSNQFQSQLRVLSAQLKHQQLRAAAAAAAAAASK